MNLITRFFAIATLLLTPAIALARGGRASTFEAKLMIGFIVLVAIGLIFSKRRR